MSFDSLPTELYSTILDHVPPEDCQQAVLSLTRALPYSPIPLDCLFHSVKLTSSEQAQNLYRRLRITSRKGDEVITETSRVAAMVQNFSSESWTVDADVLINVLQLLPNVKRLSIWIGPSNFAPEHLENLFSLQRHKLELLSLRFRPYLQKANYYQFLKGAYFDSTFISLSKWAASLGGPRTVSITQDPFVPTESQLKHSFAQPIVFFRLDNCLSSFVHSSISHTCLQHFRIRIPGRSVTYPLTTAYTDWSGSSLSQTPTFDYLDISTCSILESEVELLLSRLECLKHLVMDECPTLTRGQSDPDWWHTFGRKCALTGLKRAREREKEIMAWLKSQPRAIAAEGEGSADRIRSTRRGRKGVATATISLRSKTPPSSSAAQRVPKFLELVKDYEKVCIVPPYPTIQSIALSPPRNVGSPDPPLDNRLVCNQFETGWIEGIRVLEQKRARMYTTFARRSTGGSATAFLAYKNDAVDENERYFEGLVGVNDDNKDAIFKFNEGDALHDTSIPVLCVLGQSEQGHDEGCGHTIGRAVWGQEP